MKKEFEKQKVKGIDLGIIFLDKLLDNIKELEKKSQNDNGLSKLEIYDYRSNSRFFIKVNFDFFQSEIQEFYRDFLEHTFFIEFDWYVSFRESISRTSKIKLDLDSKITIDFFIKYLTLSLCIYSEGTNIYDYNQAYNYLVNIFLSCGIPEAKDIAFELFDGLSKDKLIIFEKDLFFRKTKFSLSNRFFDIVLHLNSIFFPKVFCSSEIDLHEKYFVSEDTSYLLENLSLVVEKIKKKLDYEKNEGNFSIYASRYFPAIFHGLNNMNVFNFDSSVLIGINKEFSDAIYAFFFYKILLTEYSFQVVICNCFPKIFTKRSHRNILNSKYDLFFL